MSKEQAEEFVKKTYTDDNFAIEVLKAGDFKPGKAGNAGAGESGMENFVRAGKALGYEFTDAEIEVATKEYLDSLGQWKAIKTFLHFARLNKKARKEMGKR